MVSLLPVVPLLALVFWNFIFFRKGWGSVLQIQYQFIFWAARILLAPLVVFYALTCWIELGRLFRLLVIQLAGFLGFLTAHFCISFAICRLLIETARNRVWDLSKTIFEEAFILNLLIYLVTVFIFYVWEYFERNKEAEKRSLLLEKSLALSRLDVLRNQLSTHFFFNTLHTISSLIMQEEKNDANQTLVRLSQLLRFSLQEN